MLFNWTGIVGKKSEDEDVFPPEGQLVGFRQKEMTTRRIIRGLQLERVSPTAEFLVEFHELFRRDLSPQGLAQNRFHLDPGDFHPVLPIFPVGLADEIEGADAKEKRQAGRVAEAR